MLTGETDMQKCGMNKTSKSKAETGIVTVELEAGITTIVHVHAGCEDLMADKLRKLHSDNIISRMEAAQQRFNPFPSLLVSAENERRLQLRDKEDRTFDGEDAEEWQRRSEEQGSE